MKKYISVLILVLVCVILSLPALAVDGGYVASKNSEVFHDPDCPYVDNILERNMVWFRSISGAVASGRRQCSLCTPKYGDYVRKESDGTSGTGSSSSDSPGISNDSTRPTTASSGGSGETVKNEISPILIIALIGFAGYYALKLFCWIGENNAQAKIRKKENAAILDRLGVSNVRLPKDVVLLPDGTPTKGQRSDRRPFGGYTVYIAEKRNVYHVKYGCNSVTRPCHLFEMSKENRPCLVCVKDRRSAIDLPEWYVRVKRASDVNEENKIGSKSMCARDNEINLHSSFIKKVKYDNNNLYLTFASGDTYVYYNVPQSVYDELVEAQSPGAYFHQKINGEYPYYRK